MSRIPAIGESPHLADVFKAFPHSVKPLLEYHDRILRDPSPLSVAERELIAAYVSGLNACSFCFGAHRIIAEAAGIEADLFDEVHGGLKVGRGLAGEADDKVRGQTQVGTRGPQPA